MQRYAILGYWLCTPCSDKRATDWRAETKARCEESQRQHDMGAGAGVDKCCMCRFKGDVSEMGWSRTRRSHMCSECLGRYEMMVCTGCNDWVSIAKGDAPHVTDTYGCPGPVAPVISW